jgi:predicted HTH transcriptional regulator
LKTQGTFFLCIPAYRNFLLDEGARFIGLCDKIGKGIDIVFESVLAGGFDFPVFESGDNRFCARIFLAHSEEFGEFVRRRSASLTSMDEILALRLLWGKSEASLREIATLQERSLDVAGRILAEMERKLMIEAVSQDRSGYRHSAAIRYDISNAFSSNQMDLDLYGDS